MLVCKVDLVISTLYCGTVSGVSDMEITVIAQVNTNTCSLICNPCANCLRSFFLVKRLSNPNSMSHSQLITISPGESAGAHDDVEHDRATSANEAIVVTTAALATTEGSKTPEASSPTGQAGNPSKYCQRDIASMNGVKEELQTAKSGQSHAVAAFQSGGDGDPSTEVKESMREYKTDLEYLEDRFKLMIILLQ